MRKRWIALAVVLCIIAVPIEIALINPTWANEQVHNLSTWIKSVFHREGPGDQGGGGESNPPVYGTAPDVSVSLTVPDAYLGDYPLATFTVTNSGDPCTVSYTVFETAPKTGSFSLGKNKNKTMTVTGPQARDIGDWSTNVQVTANNSYGSDSAQDWADFNVDVKPFDAGPYVNEAELRLAEANLHQIGVQIIRALAGLTPFTVADGYLPLTAPTNTTNAIAQALVARHPDDRELQAKEIYYCVSKWIEYNYSIFEGGVGSTLEIMAYQAKFPIQTIDSRKGICVNYALTAAVLYDAAGFDVKLIALWDKPLPIRDSRAHMAILLYMPGYGYYEPFNDGWISLDPTWGGPFGQEQGSHWNHCDVAG